MEKMKVKAIFDEKNYKIPLDFLENFWYNTIRREIMTQKELAEKYYYNENSIYKNFPAVQQGILKKYGVLIIKKGKGKKAEYIEQEKPEERQMEDLRKFLDKNPAVKEYFEGIEG